MKWNKKEMPSLATQRNSRQEFRFGKISGQQDSLWIWGAVSSRKCVPKRSKPDWILSSRIWEVLFSEPRKLAFQQGAAASCAELAGGREKARC